MELLSMQLVESYKQHLFIGLLGKCVHNIK